MVSSWFDKRGWLKTDTNLYHQYEEAEAYNQTLPDEIRFPNNCKQSSKVVYTSRLLDFKNLPQPQNSKEISQLLQKSEEISLQTSEIVEQIQEPNKNIQELLRNIQTLKEENDNLIKQLESAKKFLSSFLKEDNEKRKTEIKTQVKTLKAALNLNLKTQDLTLIVEVMKGLYRPQEENIQLKEIFKIIFPNKTFDFPTLKAEIEKLKTESLSYQIQVRKIGVDRLLIDAKNKLGEK